MEAPDRPIDALLAAYAARSLNQPLSVLVASHLEIKPDNRPYVAALEATYGVFLDEIDPVPLAGRDRRLVNIFASKDDEPARPLRHRLTPSDGLLPPALRHYLGRDIEQLQWRAILPGIKEAVIARDESGESSLLYSKPGRRLPKHTHSGLEVALVLKGAFSDATGRYQVGDIAIADEDVNHRPMIEAGDDCVCFVVAEGPAKLTGLFGKLFQRVLGE
jgi:putative transcriptional regulator